MDIEDDERARREGGEVVAMRSANAGSALI